MFKPNAAFAPDPVVQVSKFKICFTNGKVPPQITRLGFMILISFVHNSFASLACNPISSEILDPSPPDFFKFVVAT